MPTTDVAAEVLAWMSCLISHESHHRSQIMIAPRQSGTRLPGALAIRPLWQGWYWETSP